MLGGGGLVKVRLGQASCKQKLGLPENGQSALWIQCLEPPDLLSSFFPKENVDFNLPW